MYFQIENTPENVRKKKRNEQSSHNEETPRLTLAPFIPVPTVTFEDVRVNTEEVKILEVYNPAPNATQVSVVKLPPADLGVELSWTNSDVQADGVSVLNLRWTPSKEVAKRFTMQLADHKKGRYDVFVVCKSLENKKPTQGKKRPSVISKPTSSKRSPKIVKTKRLISKNKMFIPIMETHRYESFVNVESTLIKDISMRYKMSPPKNLSPPVVSSKLPDPWTLTISEDIRRETYLVNDTYDYDKENDSSFPPISQKNLVDKNKSNGASFSPSSMLSAIEKLEFTPVKVTKNYFTKENVPFQKNKDYVDDCFSNTPKHNNFKNESLLKKNIDSLIDDLVLTPLREFNGRPMGLRDNRINHKAHIETSGSPKLETINYVTINKHYDLSPNLDTQNIAPANLTHPIIDLCDISNCSKLDIAQRSEQNPTITIDLVDKVNYGNVDKMDVSEIINFTPNNKSISNLLDGSLQGFNPKRCSTERKECDHTQCIGTNSKACRDLFVSYSPGECLNATYGKLSSGTYTKGDSPIVPLEPSNQSSPYSICGSPTNVNIAPNLVDLQINYAVPRKLPFSENTKNFNERNELRNAFRDKNSASGVKDIIEANMWQKSPPRSSSPSCLAPIPEESTFLSEVSMQDPTRKNHCETFVINKTFEVPKPVNKTNNVETSKWSKTGINWETKKTNIIHRSFTKSSVSKLSENIQSRTNVDEVILDADYNYTSIKSVATTIDPFLASTCLYDERAYNELEKEFKTWINYLLTPPADLDTNLDNSKIDIGKAWIESRNKIVPAAPTKEQVSAKYHTSHRLDSLRKSAKVFIKNPNITQVFIKVSNQVERKILSIRTDKNIHLDVGLQKIILNLLLCYNPLWLRIGLETLYDKNIPLTSNDDFMGLSAFIIERMFKDPYTNSKHAHNSLVNMYSQQYMESVKKFTLKKFLFLVYFLDQAKQNKIIPHDPCLFCRNAIYKESRELLCQFTKEVLAGIGDITKHLKPTGYVVAHKQTYLHEFKYAVHNLAVDLKDGVRLTRLMEVILMKENLIAGLRTPAISRLQKIHNVKVALTALESAGFQIIGDITAKDIADGHREKTLSLLWQLINKFRAPLFCNAALIIQKWWRKKYLSICVEKRIENKKKQRLDRAATIIQSWWKSIYYRRQYLIMLKYERENYERKKQAAIVLQKAIKGFLCRRSYLQMKSSTLKIQSFYRMYRIRNKYIILKESVIQIQAIYRMYKLRKQYQQLKESTIIIQRHFRNLLLTRKIMRQYILTRESIVKIQSILRMWLVRKRYLAIRRSVILIQNAYRERCLKEIERQTLLKRTSAATKIQAYWRSYLQRRSYENLRSAVVLCQQRRRALVKMRKDRESYKLMRISAVKIQATVSGWLARKAVAKIRAERESARILFVMNAAATVIQKHWRCHQNYKLQQEHNALDNVRKRWRQGTLQTEREHFIILRYSVITIQSVYRTLVVRRTYLKNKQAVTKIQNLYRMYRARKEYLTLKESAVKIQVIFRMYKARKAYIKLKESTIKIQSYFKMYRARSEYLIYKRSALQIQSMYRMYRTRRDYLQLKQSVLKIQSYYRMYKALKEFKAIKESTIKIQSLFRMHKAKTDFLRLKQATIKIQATFRMYKAKMEYYKLLQSVVKIQSLYKMVKTRNEYLKMKNSSLQIQTMYRGYIARREYCKLRESTVRIQTYYRMYIAKKEFIKLKESVLKIQSFYRMHKNRKDYQILRESALKIQSYYRMYIDRKLYLKLKESTVKIQSLCRMYHERMIYLKLKDSAVKIQAFYRMYKVRKQYLNLNESATKIQSAYRMYRNKKEYKKIKDSAIKIQSLFRMRKERTAYLKYRESAIKIQSFYKMHQRDKEFKKIKNSVVIIQSVFKMLRAKREYLELKNATVKLQALCRMKIARTEYLKLQRSVVKIQSVYRMYNAVKEYNKLKQSVIKLQSLCRMLKARKEFLTVKTSTVKIQSVYRMYKARKEFLQLKESIVKIQTFCRMCCARKRYNEMRRATLKIQSVYRAHIASKHYSKLKESSIKIQTMFRMYRTRQQYLKMKESAVKIQTFYRMCRMRKEFLKLTKSAVQLQTFYRMYRLRTQFLNMKKSTLYIQSLYRMCKARSEFIILRQASIKIQSFYKMYRVRKNYLAMRQSTIQIQAAYRMYRVRKNYLAMRLSTIQIQAAYRMYRVRKNYLAMRQSTIQIQAAYRMYRVRKNYLAMRQSTIQIQAAYRMYRVRKNYLAMRQSTIQIQAAYRMYRVRKQYITLKKSAVTLQRHFRNLSVTRNCMMQYIVIRKSVITIQSFVRMWIVRKRYLAVCKSVRLIQITYRHKCLLEKERQTLIEKTRAACKIQACWRGYVERCRYKKLREVVVTCQQRRRAIVAMRNERQSYRLLRESAVKIQAAICGWLTRKSVSKMREERIRAKRFQVENDAAMIIQKHWRGHAVRKDQEDQSKVAKLRKRWREGALQSDQLTLAERNQDAMDVLCHFKDVASVIRAFKTLDYVTNVYPMMYGTRETAVPIITRLVAYMDATNRSVSTMETLQLGVAILLNLTKYTPTAHYVYTEGHVNSMLTLMLRWCDKDNLLSRLFCTLLWMFGKYEDIHKDMSRVLSETEAYKKLCKIRCSLVRRRRMESRKRSIHNTLPTQYSANTSILLSKSFNDSMRHSMTPVKSMRFANSHIPTTEPDYGIIRTDHPRIFMDEIQAIDAVFLKFNLQLNNISDS